MLLLLKIIRIPVDHDTLFPVTLRKMNKSIIVSTKLVFHLLVKLCIDGVAILDGIAIGKYHDMVMRIGLWRDLFCCYRKLRSGLLFESLNLN